MTAYKLWHIKIHMSICCMCICVCLHQISQKWCTIGKRKILPSAINYYVCGPCDLSNATYYTHTYVCSETIHKTDGVIIIIVIQFLTTQHVNKFKHPNIWHRHWFIAFFSLSLARTRTLVLHKTLCIFQVPSSMLYCFFGFIHVIILCLFLFFLRFMYTCFMLQCI